MTNNDAFKANFARMLKRAGDNVQIVARLAALELQSMMIKQSPVDTGRFKGNWQAGVGAANGSKASAEDNSPLGEQDLGKSYTTAQAALQGWKPGQTIYLTNSMPYATRLEYGWSKQAPSGMVRLAVQNYSAAIAKALGEVK